MIHRVVATIDLQALEENLQQLKIQAPDSKLLAVVKADAYGHGVSRLLSALKQCDGLAVARLSEALDLRNSGFQGKIVVLGGVLSQDEVVLAARYKLDLVVHSNYQVDLIEDLSSADSLDIWIKYDSGMNRLGFKTENSFTDAYCRLNNDQRTLRFMTHFASADVVESETTLQQVARFNSLRAKFPDVECSMSNSAATLRFPEFKNDWIRPGLALFGVAPVNTQLQLKPVMRLSSVVVATWDLAQGESIGYGHSWTADRDTRIAIVGIGYGDGYPRSVKTGTPVCIRNRHYPIVGRVSMDMMYIEVDANVEIGDEVELWGDQLNVADIAEDAGTIAWELLLNLTSRVHFVYR